MGLKTITVALGNTKYMIYNTSMMPSMPMIHALQILATCRLQYHKYILPRAKMHISIRTKIASPSEFKSDSNALIFSLIGHELSELHEFYKMDPEMEIFRAAPSVLQTAVTSMEIARHISPDRLLRRLRLILRLEHSISRKVKSGSTL